MSNATLRNPFVLLFLVLAATLIFPASSAAVCCSACSGETCADGASCSGRWYCGVGGCNIFGCNCDGGCRASTSRAQCQQYCETASHSWDMRCTYGCPPVVLDSCAIHCSEIAARNRDECSADCARRFPVGAAVATVADAAKAGLILFSKGDSDHSGSIDRQELAAVLKAGPSCASGRSAAIDADEASAFAALDQDGNGTITLDEVDRDAFAYVKANHGTRGATTGLNAEYVDKIIDAATTGGTGAR